MRHILHEYQWNLLPSFSLGHTKTKQKETLMNTSSRAGYFYSSYYIANHRLSFIKLRAPPNHELSTYDPNVDRLSKISDKLV